MSDVKEFIVKYKFPLLGLTVLIIGGILFFMHNPSKPKTVVSTSVVLQKTKEIDKLYTGVYIIPAIDRKYGYRKRDLPSHFLNQAKEWAGLGNGGDEQKKVIKGYCKKRYEVSVGYDNISELLSNKELIDNACHGRSEKLPNPQILAVNCRNTEARGDYSGNDMCYRWDVDEKMRKSLLLAEMKNNKIIDKVNKRGRESLKTLATIFCE